MSTIFIYGAPGSGKTTACASLARNDQKVIIVDVDGKADTMVNLDQYRDNLIIHKVKSPLVEGGLLSKVKNEKLTKQPEGYLEICSIVDKIIEEPHPNDIFVLDSLSRVVDHAKRLIKFRLNQQAGGKATDSNNYAQWGMLLNFMEELFDYTTHLPFKHVIVLAHELFDKDEATGLTTISPFIEGSFRNKVSSYVEEMYYARAETKGESTTYTLTTKPIKRIAAARTSRDLPVIFESDKLAEMIGG